MILDRDKKTINFRIGDFPPSAQAALISQLDMNGIIANEPKFRETLAEVLPDLGDDVLQKKIIEEGKIHPLLTDSEKAQFGLDFSRNSYDITLFDVPGQEGIEQTAPDEGTQRVLPGIDKEGTCFITTEPPLIVIAAEELPLDIEECESCKEIEADPELKERLKNLGYNVCPKCAKPLEPPVLTEVPEQEETTTPPPEPPSEEKPTETPKAEEPEETEEGVWVGEEEPKAEEEKIDWPYRSRLSFSSISMYEECPKKWQYRYAEGRPEVPRHFFSFGRSLHNALDALHRDPTPPSLPDLLNYFEEVWEGRGYRNKEEQEYYKDYGKKLLVEYYRKNITDKYKKAYRTEKEVKFKIAGVDVVGWIDRVERSPGGKFQVVDYKTGKKFKAEDVKDSEQLKLYQMALESTGRKVDKLSLYHLPTQTSFDVEAHSPEAIEAYRRKIVGIIKKMANKEFEPRPEISSDGKPAGRCARCDFQNICPVWHDLYEKGE